MKKAFMLLAACTLGGTLFAQKTNEKVIILNSGKFEFSPPFTDYVTVGAYNPFTKSYKVFDTIGSQSGQGVLLDEKTGFVLAENTIVKYDFQSEKRTATGVYHGVSPRSMTLTGNRLLVGNWYGQSDSFLYAYNASTLALEYIVKEVAYEAKAILAIGDTAYISQNTKGTIDQCPNFGCYNDSIGFLSLVRISTGAFIGNIVLGDTAAGISDLYKYGNTIVTLNRQANTISFFDLTTQVAQTIGVAGFLGKGLGVVNDNLHFILNGKAAIFNLFSKIVMSTNLTPITNPAAIAYEPITNKYYQTKTDYSNYGSLIASLSNATLDSVSVGVSPEAIGLYYSINEAPIATNDFIQMSYLKDTLINVLNNDVDSTFAPIKVKSVSTPLVFGATAVVDSATGYIRYTPAAGIETFDTLAYIVCDIAGSCDTAFVYFQITGITTINEVSITPFSVYPNPFSDNLYINGIQIEAEVRVYNLVGQKLLSQSLKPNDIMHLEQLSKGSYILQVAEEKSFSTFSIVKE